MRLSFETETELKANTFYAFLSLSLRLSLRL